MDITINALRPLFEESYLALLQKQDGYLLKHAEEAKKSFFRRRIGGDYEMVMVEMAWIAYQWGWIAAGGKIHGTSEEERPPAPPEQTIE